MRRREILGVIGAAPPAPLRVHLNRVRSIRTTITSPVRVFCALAPPASIEFLSVRIRPRTGNRREF